MLLRPLGHLSSIADSYQFIAVSTAGKIGFANFPGIKINFDPILRYDGVSLTFFNPVVYCLFHSLLTQKNFLKERYS